MIMWANMDLWYNYRRLGFNASRKFACVLTFSMFKAFNQRSVNKQGEPSEPDCRMWVGYYINIDIDCLPQWTNQTFHSHTAHI